MIDIHNHIIFGVDDGSKSIEQSIRMIKSANEIGITEICFSPHYMEDGYHTERCVLEEKVDELRKIIQQEGIEVKLYLGEEVFIFPNMPESLDKLVCLNDSHYILMEIPLVESISYIDDVIYRLLSYGKTPIIAHPERYLASEKDFGFVEHFLEKGALLQINVNSLIGHYGKPAKLIATKLLKNDMVQFIGSDAHSSATYNAMKESLLILKKLIGEEKYQELVEDNPRKVLNDEIVEYDVSLLQNIHSTKENWITKLLRKKVES